MFTKAIEEVTKFTRPFLAIYRVFGETDVMKNCATFIIINDEGWILTCKHVAEEIRKSEQVAEHYAKFKEELATISKGTKHYKTLVKGLEKKYGYGKNKNIMIQQLVNFAGAVDKSTGCHYYFHPTCDIALIHFDGFEKVLCEHYPVFAKDSSKIKQGKSLCRLGYPYPEFNNFRYNEEEDRIEWTSSGKSTTPLFPIDGILTRHVVNDEGKIIEIELSTPGLKGQSGGPLFDVNGVIYGVQSYTISLHLGFDVVGAEIRLNGKMKEVDNFPFMHLGRCVHVDIIKAFMDEHGVKYKTEE